MTAHRMGTREGWLAARDQLLEREKRHAREGDELALGALVLVLAAAGWTLTGVRMSGMDASPAADLGGVGAFTLTWAAMMAGMMLLSAPPAALAHARLRHDGSGRWPGLGGRGAMFLAGYLIAWTLAGVLGYALLESVRSLHADTLSWDRAGRYLAAGVLLGASLYQLSSAKDACLRRCRSPRPPGDRPRAGALGALRGGVAHGAYCIGCCWALMAALFALGVMNLLWMAAIAALIGAERLLPRRALTVRAIAALLAALALGVALAPERVPGLTLPAASHGAHAIKAMAM
jgi:predicted metal-binding membrane protein